MGGADGKPRRLTLVPDLVSNHFAIQSSGNKVEMRRAGRGEWNLRLSVVPRKGAEESWAGYCWALNAVDGRIFENLKVRISQLAAPQEIQFKLEKTDNRFQDRTLRLPVVGDNAVPLGNFSKVQGEIGRFCLVLAAPIDGTRNVAVDITLAEVWLE